MNQLCSKWLNYNNLNQLKKMLHIFFDKDDIVISDLTDKIRLEKVNDDTCPSAKKNNLICVDRVQSNVEKE